MEELGLTARLYRAMLRHQARRHGYTVTGLENLPAHGPALVVGYHGRVIALDMLLLLGRLTDAGREAWGLAHRGIHASSWSARLAEDLRLLDASPVRVREVVARGGLILVTPGGALEGMRTAPKYTVRWTHSMGYLKLAAREGLPIVPVGAAGVDDTWTVHWSRQVRMGPSFGTTVLGTGRGRWPLVPFGPPNLVRIHQRIGAPVVLPAAAPEDEGWRDHAHLLVQRAVQAQLDLARDDVRCGTAPAPDSSDWPGPDRRR